ncbi:uncharacterized protein LOC132750182 [Ruditapes philippinarum]|uniref:uncharacterized protein LOC132750182 n=1 Tax=Ruditapes philippinarum TaxID=129788 RepID=UPI00295A7AD5|nr:uncharacterized protein LOC132750182 [Ruditapes philippinarum]
MVAIDAQNPPKWVKSSLDLTENDNLDTPQLTTRDEILAATFQKATELCNGLISDMSSSISGSSVEGLTSIHNALCILESSKTDENTQAEAVMAGYADLYMGAENSTTNPLQESCDLESLTDYIGAGGNNCDVNCYFGNVINDTCICYDSHWGLTCNKICPSGNLGGCNTYGVCDSQIGICNCHPRHYSNSKTVAEFWTNYLSSSNMSMPRTYACESCSSNWIGKDCEFAQSSKSSYAGIIYGSYISTFDGVSLTHATPGVYAIIKSSSVNIQALFLPCVGTYTCRYLKEVSMRVGSASLIIQHNPGTNVTLNLLGTELSFPITQSSSGIGVEWTEEEFIKITFKSSKLIIFDSNFGLVATADIQSDIASNNEGLLGSADGSWTNDIQCKDETDTLNQNDITGSYAGKCLRANFIVSTDDAIIAHEHGSESLSSGGHALQLLTGQSFTISGLTLTPLDSKFTISFWSKSNILSKKRSATSYSLLSTDVGSQNLILQVNSGNLEIIWDSTYTTSLTINTDTWYYISLTWQSSDGTLTIYLMTEYTSESSSIPDVNTGATINVEQITISASSSASVTIDCIRLWAKHATDKDAGEDMHAYCSATESDKSLMFSLPFDEGEGTTSSMTLYDSTSGMESGSATGTLAGSSTEEMWIPSSIPIHAVHLPDRLTSYSRFDVPDYTNAARDCLEVINNETLTDNCASMTSSIKDFYLEACIREYERAGSEDAMKILLYSLIYYCVSVTGASECSFEDYFYFCEEEEDSSSSEFPFWIIILIVIVILLIAAIIIVVVYKKKHSKGNQALEEEELVSEVPHRKFDRTKLRTRETSFMSTTSTRIASPTWSEDGRSSAASMTSRGTINSRFFESPIMFIGSPPTSTQEFGRSPTPSSSRGWSPLSFLSGKGSVSPEPINIKVNSSPSGNINDKQKPKDKKEATVSAASGSQAAVTKMLEKARANAGTTSPHPINPPNKMFSQPQPSTTRALATPASTPLPPGNSSAPTSIFGARGTPLPKFSAPTSIFGNRDTPQPKFSTDTSSGRGSDTRMPTVAAKGISIPRQPASSMSLGSRSRRQSNTQSNLSNILDDLDTQ